MITQSKAYLVGGGIGRTRLFMGLSPAQQGVAQKSVRGDARDRREPSGSFAESAWY